jgi:hypothetical protein
VALKGEAKADWQREYMREYMRRRREAAGVKRRVPKPPPPPPTPAPPPPPIKCIFCREAKSPMAGSSLGDYICRDCAVEAIAMIDSSCKPIA